MSRYPHILFDLDGAGYRETAAYAGVGELLAELAGAGLTLSIATNKRIHPTRLILDHLGWRGHFTHVYALDLISPRLPNKAAMIARLLADQDIAKEQAIYIGNRSEDGESADANGLPFIAVTWGYGSLNTDEMRAGWRRRSRRHSGRCCWPIKLVRISAPAPCPIPEFRTDRPSPVATNRTTNTLNQ